MITIYNIKAPYNPISAGSIQHKNGILDSVSSLEGGLRKM
jgi:hypothetical protein